MKYIGIGALAFFPVLVTTGLLPGHNSVHAQDEKREIPEAFLKTERLVKMNRVDLAKSGLSIQLPHTLKFETPVRGDLPLNEKEYSGVSTFMHVDASPLLFPLKYPFAFGGIVVEFDKPVGDDAALTEAFTKLYVENLPKRIQADSTESRKVTIENGRLRFVGKFPLPDFSNAFLYDGRVIEETVVDGIKKRLGNKADLVIIGKGKIVLAMYFLHSFQWVPPADSKIEFLDPDKEKFESYLISVSLKSLKKK